MGNKTYTQQGAFRKDRNALNTAKEKKISDKEIINQMAGTHSNPYSPEAYSEASGAMLHTRANMNCETPIADAVAEILRKKARERARQKAQKGLPDPA